MSVCSDQLQWKSVWRKIRQSCDVKLVELLLIDELINNNAPSITSRAQSNDSANKELLPPLTKCMIPAAVNHTDIKIETNCAKRMELDVLRIFKYWRMSGTLMSRSARRKRRPKRCWCLYKGVAGHTIINKVFARQTHQSTCGLNISIQRTGVS